MTNEYKMAVLLDAMRQKNRVDTSGLSPTLAAAVEALYKAVDAEDPEAFAEWANGVLKAVASEKMRQKWPASVATSIAVEQAAVAVQAGKVVR